MRVAPLLGWRDVDLAALTREALPVAAPTLVENDANAFAFGDAYVRRHRGRGVTLVLVIESGVGGGVIVDGRLFRGGHGVAGEIGHLHTQDADGAELEEAIGLGRLLRRYGRAGGLAGLLADVRAREPAALALAEEWARHLAFALVQSCRVLDPDRIVLGGAGAALYPLVAGRVGFHLENLQSEDFPVPEIVVHDAAETGAAYGVACMMHQRFLAQGEDGSADEADEGRMAT